MTVHGRRVEFRTTRAFPSAVDATEGRDGSVLVVRSRIETGAVTTSSASYTIWYKGRERDVPVGAAEVYVDRKNYAGYYIPASSQTPPWDYNGDMRAFAMENGKRLEFGPGDVRAWIPGKLAVTLVSVDETLTPAGQGTAIGNVVRLIGPFGHVTFPLKYQFKGCTSDGASTVVTEPESPNESKTVQRVVVCRNGRVVRQYELPQSWAVVGTAPSGWMLVRKLRDLSVDDREFGDWTIGVLSNGTLTPITFSKPADSNGLLWVGENEDVLFGRRAFMLNAQYGSRDAWYRVSPLKARTGPFRRKRQHLS